MAWQIHVTLGKWPELDVPQFPLLLNGNPKLTSQSYREKRIFFKITVTSSVGMGYILPPFCYQFEELLITFSPPDKHSSFLFSVALSLWSGPLDLSNKNLTISMEDKQT